MPPMFPRAQFASRWAEASIITSAQETFRDIISFVLPAAVQSEMRRIATSSNTTSRLTSGTTPYETYSRHLSLMGHGYPVWIPEPNEHLHVNYRKQGVNIGDVVIFTGNGALDFVFNICRPADDPINSNGVPEGFLPFTPELTSWDKRRYQQYGEGSYLASKSISKRTDLMGPSGLVFLSSAPEGAILTMPKGAYSEDLARVSGFDEYLAANLESWYEYVNDVRGWGVEMGKLHLVTGAHKSKAWGMATFSSRSDVQADELRLRFRSKEDPLYGTLYCWDYEGESDCPRAGPTLEQKQSLYERLSQGVRRHLSTPPPESQHEAFENQCLFVRTVNAALRISTKAKKLQTDVTAPLSLGFRGRNSYETGPTSFIRQSSSAYGKHQGSSTTHPQLTPIVRNSPKQIEHPSEIINEFLLHNMSGSTVITHDHHWMSLLTQDDVVFPNKDELLSRLKISYKFIVNKGVISLKSIEDLSLETPSVGRNRYQKARLSYHPVNTSVSQLQSVGPPTHMHNTSTYAQNGEAEFPPISIEPAWQNLPDPLPISYNRRSRRYRYGGEKIAPINHQTIPAYNYNSTAHYIGLGAERTADNEYHEQRAYLPEPFGDSSGEVVALGSSTTIAMHNMLSYTPSYTSHTPSYTSHTLSYTSHNPHHGRVNSQLHSVQYDADNFDDSRYPGGDMHPREDVYPGARGGIYPREGGYPDGGMYPRESGYPGEGSSTVAHQFSMSRGYSGGYDGDSSSIARQPNKGFGL